MKRFLTFTFILLLTACAQDGSYSGPMRTPNYSQYGITRLNVNQIQIVNSYIPPYHDPNVEHTLYLPPYVALRDWAQNRFQSVGNMGVAKIEILDASIVRSGLPVKDDFMSFFNDQVSTQYRMQVKVRITIISPRFDNQPYAEVTVNKMLQTYQSTSLASRDAQLHDMVTSMVAQVNKLMTTELQNKLPDMIE